MTALEKDYHGIVSTTVNPLSAIPDGQELDIDFVIGDIGGGASNGDTDFYYIQVGDRAPGTTTTSLGQACGSCVRDGGLPITVGAVVGSIFTDNLASILGGAVGGDLGLMANVIDGTLAHEIGHTLGLDHCFKAGSVTNNGNAPLMGTGAFDMPNGDRLTDREFSFSCNVPAIEGGGVQNDVEHLVSVLGLRDAPASETELPVPGMASIFAMGIAGIGATRRRKAA
jgi:hypothetical protein